MSSGDLVTTEIHKRVKLSRDGTRTVRTFVRCPRGGAWEPIEWCRRCASCAHLSTPATSEDWVLLCDAPAPKRGRGFVARAERTPVTAVMEPSVLCADADVPVPVLAAAMRDGDVELAIVVDRDDRPIGVVAPVDLANARGKTASQAMTPFATSLLEDAPVSRAIALVTAGDLEHIPVLSGGRVMGLVSPRSVLAWMTLGK